MRTTIRKHNFGQHIFLLRTERSKIHLQYSMAPRRKAPATSSGRPTARQKQSVADQLICPITLELPFDPVTAEDGYVRRPFCTQDPRMYVPMAK